MFARSVISRTTHCSLQIHYYVGVREQLDVKKGATSAHHSNAIPSSAMTLQRPPSAGHSGKHAQLGQRRDPMKDRAGLEFECREVGEAIGTTRKGAAHHQRPSSRMVETGALPV